MNLIHIIIFVDRLHLSITNYIDNKKITIKNEEVIFPASFNIGDRLNYIKKIVSMMIDSCEIDEYKVELDKDIGVEIIDAVKIEGVLEELFSCKGVRLWR